MKSLRDNKRWRLTAKPICMHPRNLANKCFRKNVFWFVFRVNLSFLNAKEQSFIGSSSLPLLVFFVCLFVCLLLFFVFFVFFFGRVNNSQMSMNTFNWMHKGLDFAQQVYGVLWGSVKRPSHVKLMLANSCWQTQIGVWTTQQNVGKPLAKIETSFIYLQQYANMYRLHTPICCPTRVWRVKAA